MTDIAHTETDPAKNQSVEVKVLLEAYRAVLLCVFVATLLIIVIMSATLLALYKGMNIPVLPYVALAGALGAFFSALMRLYDFQDLPKAILGQGLGLHNGYLIIYSLVPPIVGAIGATALYVAFASGLINGPLFPKFGCHPPQTDVACDTFKGFVQGFAPNEAVDCAKVLVWGFLAGFSERLVPDLFKTVTEAKS